jgi:hypothetical protein
LCLNWYDKKVKSPKKFSYEQMRAEFRSSKLKTYWKKPKTCALFEHEYEIELTDD